MDQIQLQQKIAEYYAKLPSAAGAAFASMIWLETLKTLSTKYNLSETQIATLGTETTLAFLGIVPMDEYKEILINELALPKEILDSLISEINESIFKPIRPELIEAYEKNVATQEAPLDPRFANLPQELQRAIAQSDYQKKLYEIGTKYKLPVNKMAILEEVTVKFITGAISPSQYESELTLSTELEASKVKEIATDVNDLILVGIREFMKNPTEAEDAVPLPPYAKKVEAVTASLEKIKIPKIPMKESVLSDVIQPIQAAKPLSAPESNIYQDAGIEMVIDEEKPMDLDEEKETTMKEDGILAQSGISMIAEKPEAPREHILPTLETQKAALEGIEHPDDVATSIIGDKLGGVTMSRSTTSSYSLPKITGPVQQVSSTTDGVKKIDPYHEAI